MSIPVLILILTKDEGINLPGCLQSVRWSNDIHYHLYDRLSLSAMLAEAGSKEVAKENKSECAIPDWSRYKLDLNHVIIYNPSSLFMEAQK